MLSSRISPGPDRQRQPGFQSSMGLASTGATWDGVPGGEEGRLTWQLQRIRPEPSRLPEQHGAPEGMA